MRTAARWCDEGQEATGRPRLLRVPPPNERLPPLARLYAAAAARALAALRRGLSFGVGGAGAAAGRGRVAGLAGALHGWAGWVAVERVISQGLVPSSCCHAALEQL